MSNLYSFKTVLVGRQKESTRRSYRLVSVEASLRRPRFGFELEPDFVDLVKVEARPGHTLELGQVGFESVAAWEAA